MANVFATKTGNWSDVTVWNTGALPTTADDVYSNTFTVTIDQNVKILSIRNTAASPAVAGGTYILTGDFTVECTGTGLFAGSVNLLTYNGTGNAIIKSNIPQSGSGASLVKSSTGICNVIGNIYSSGQYTCLVSGSGTFNVIGGLFANIVSSCIWPQANNITINITGNLNSSSGNCIIIENGTNISNCIINVTGNVNTTGTVLPAINLRNTNCAGTVNILGNLLTTTSQAAIGGGALFSVNITGTITASLTSPAVSITNASAQLNLDNAIMINSTTRLAVSATIITLTTGTSLRWQFYNKTNTGFVNLYPAGVSLGNPATANVRNGTTYGPSLELTGTLAVPPVGSVLLGVPTDNTTGTYSATAEAIAAELWNAQTTALTTSGSIGERLKNAATVSSTAAQIASF